MADEDLSIAAPAVETPSEPAVEPVDTEAPETPEVPKDVGGESEEEEAPANGEPEDEEDELDFAFKKYRVPKSLKTAVEAMRADYTQKTQSTAETAKALEAREAAISQQAEATEVELNARAAIKHVKSEIERFAAFDFTAYQQLRYTDPMAADEAWAYKQDLKEQHSNLEATLTKADAERTDKAQQDLAKRVQETLEAAPKIIPGLTAETRADAIDKLVAYAHSKGIPEQVLKANWSPVFLELLHEAHVGSLAIKQQSAPKPSPKPAVTPLVTVKAASSPTTTKSLADIARGDDMDAYVAARKAGRVR